MILRSFRTELKKRPYKFQNLQTQWIRKYYVLKFGLEQTMKYVYYIIKPRSDKFCLGSFVFIWSVSFKIGNHQ